MLLKKRDNGIGKCRFAGFKETVSSEMKETLENCVSDQTCFLLDSEEWVKIHKEGKLQQTPEGMTGNELDFNSKRRKATGEAAQENPEDSEEVQESDEEYED